MLPQEIQHATMYVIQSNTYKKNYQVVFNRSIEIH